MLDFIFTPKIDIAKPSTILVIQIYIIFLKYHLMPLFHFLVSAERENRRHRVSFGLASTVDEREEGPSDDHDA
jgi:hypothetical protein